jgi:hypothetical protein
VVATLIADFAGGRDERRYEEAACRPLLRDEAAPELAAIRRRLGARAAAEFGHRPADAEPGWAVRVRATR